MRLFTYPLLLVAALGIAEADTINLTFITLPSTYENGSYNGFVGGYSNTGVGGNQTFTNLLCDDFLATTYVPSGPDLYTVENITDFSISATKWGASELTQYEETALLMYGDGASLTGLDNAVTADAITSYQYAIWRLFTPDSQIDSHLSGGTANFGDSSALMAQALADVTTGSVQYQFIYSALKVYTPDPIPNGPQEFLQMGTVTKTADTNGGGGVSATPEPLSMLLTGTGILLLIVAARRYRRT